MAERRLVLVTCFFLVVLTLAVFGRTLGYEFVSFDDDVYVYDNPVVSAGLTFHGLALALTHGSDANWDPLTTISHMVDCQLYGLHAGGHHLTNLILHTASVILLFLVLRQMTGAFWRSALVAAVFAIHPLRVESVAWVSERKDTLSGLFFILTLGAYVRYTRKPAPFAYLLVVLCFVLGLMSKAMLVTLPIVLLLLDWWPLKRWNPTAVPDRAANEVWWLNKIPVPRRLILEKLPFLLLSLGSCIVAVVAQRHANTVQSLEKYPFILRLCNALNSVLATSPDSTIRNGPRAVEVAQYLVQKSAGNNPLFLSTLAAARAESGQFGEAIAVAEEAFTLASTQGNGQLAEAIKVQISVYKSGRPFRETR